MKLYAAKWELTYILTDLPGDPVRTGQQPDGTRDVPEDVPEDET